MVLHTSDSLYFTYSSKIKSINLCLAQIMKQCTCGGISPGFYKVSTPFLFFPFLSFYLKGNNSLCTSARLAHHCFKKCSTFIFLEAFTSNQKSSIHSIGTLGKSKSPVWASGRSDSCRHRAYRTIKLGGQSIF